MPLRKAEEQLGLLKEERAPGCLDKFRSWLNDPDTAKRLSISILPLPLLVAVCDLLFWCTEFKQAVQDLSRWGRAVMALELLGAVTTAIVSGIRFNGMLTSIPLPFMPLVLVGALGVFIWNVATVMRKYKQRHDVQPVGVVE
jgi:hypothetical protein